MEFNTFVEELLRKLGIFANSISHNILSVIISAQNCISLLPWKWIVPPRQEYRYLKFIMKSAVTVLYQIQISNPSCDRIR